MTMFVLAAIVLLIALIVVVLNLWARRSGYAIPGQTAVRCGKGHLFRMTWVVGGSLTMLKLGPLRRYGRCPIGNHWSTIRPVKEADLTESERRILEQQADV